MAMDAETIETMIKDGIPGAVVRIDDLRGDGEHYAAHVTSDLFEGKSRLEQHRMVQKALKGKLEDGELHALAIQTSTPK